MEFADLLLSVGVSEDIINKLKNVEYKKSDNPKQNRANYLAKAVPTAKSLLDEETFTKVMESRSCCKTGNRLKNSKQFHFVNRIKPIEEKVRLLGDLIYMGKPFLNDDGDLETIAVGSWIYQQMKCPCPEIGGLNPESDQMPLAYCECCANHFKFHYQIALNLKLRLKKVKSTILNSAGKSPCVFVYEVEKSG